MPRPDKNQGWGADDEPVSSGGGGWGANDTPVAQATPAPASRPSIMGSLGDAAGRYLKTAASDLSPMNMVSALSNPASLFQKNQPGPTSPPVGILDKARRLMSGGQGAPPAGDPAIVDDLLHARIPETLGHATALVAGGKIPPLLGRGARAIAEPLAESAMGVTAKNRLFDANPGKALLDNTRGIKADTIRESGQQRLSDLNAQAQQAAKASQGYGSLAPALSVADQAMKTARGANASGTAAKLEPMKDYLTMPGKGFSGITTPGGKISPYQDPEQLLQMRTAFPENFNDTYGAEVSHGVRATGRGIYRAMSDEAKRTVPELRTIDPQIHDLIPAVERAATTDAKAGLIQNLIHRFGVHTGALAGAGLGYATHGLPGAVAGAVLPEMVANPTVQMVEARGLNALSKGLKSPAAINAGKAVPIVNLANRRDQR